MFLFWQKNITCLLPSFLVFRCWESRSQEESGARVARPPAALVVVLPHRCPAVWLDVQNMIIFLTWKEHKPRYSPCALLLSVLRHLALGFKSLVPSGGLHPFLLQRRGRGVWGLSFLISSRPVLWSWQRADPPACRDDKDFQKSSGFSAFEILSPFSLWPVKIRGSVKRIALLREKSAPGNVVQACPAVRSLGHTLSPTRWLVAGPSCLPASGSSLVNVSLARAVLTWF